MIAIFYNEYMYISFSQTNSNFLKNAGECSFRASRGVKFPKFPEVAPNDSGCSLTAVRITWNTFYIWFEPWLVFPKRTTFSKCVGKHGASPNIFETYKGSLYILELYKIWLQNLTINTLEFEVEMFSPLKQVYINIFKPCSTFSDFLHFASVILSGCINLKPQITPVLFKFNILIVLGALTFFS